MSKRRGIFSIIWIALWTLGAFIALTQLWLQPEEGQMMQKLVLAGFGLVCVIGWIAAARALFRAMTGPDARR